MNFSQLRTMVSNWVSDPNQSYFTPSMINTWLNNAQHEAQKLLLQAAQNYYLVRATTPLVVGQSDYVLPEDFLKLNRLEVIVSGTAPNETTSPVASMTLNQQDLVFQTSGVPSLYYLKKNRIVLSPAPDSTYTLRLYYSYQASDMVLDSDIPDVPEEFQEYLAVLACLDAFLMDQRDPGPFLEKKKYYETLMKNEAQERQEDGPRMVVQTGECSGEWYY